jgi:hypothetical protein
MVPLAHASVGAPAWRRMLFMTLSVSFPTVIPAALAASTVSLKGMNWDPAHSAAQNKTAAGSPLPTAAFETSET